MAGRGVEGPHPHPTPSAEVPGYILGWRSGGKLNHSKGVVTQLQKPGWSLTAPRRPRQAGTNPGSCSAGTAKKQSPQEGACSPGHRMKQRGKILGPGEDGIPQQPGTAAGRNAARLQPGSERGRAALPAAVPRGRGLTARGLGRRAREQLEANGEKFTRYETWQNKVREETLQICTEVHPALAVELFK